MRLISGLVVIAGLAGTPFASAQVFKCTEADGKTVYSQAPCSKADNKEKVVKLMAEPISDTPVHGTAPADIGTTNAQTNSTANNKGNGGGQPLPPYGLMRKPASSPGSSPSTQQIIAECEANHGARCSSAAEINYRRQEKRTPSAQEQATIQDAIRARREREEEQRERAFRR